MDESGRSSVEILTEYLESAINLFIFSQEHSNNTNIWYETLWIYLSRKVYLYLMLNFSTQTIASGRNSSNMLEKEKIYYW